MGDLGSSEPAGDLFDRWLAHHEGRPPEAESQATEPEPTAEPAAEAVAAAEPAVEPVHRPSHLAETAPAASDLPDQHLAAASIVAALQPAAAPAVVVPDERAAIPHTIFFKPRSGTQQLLGAVLLCVAALTLVTALWAWHDRTYLSYGIAAVSALVTAVVWATRASASPARLTMHGSELEIVSDGSRALFDLAGPHTELEMQGRPGDRRWRVLILRRSMSPYVIDATMVDAVEFTRVLRYYRPEI